MTFHSGYCSVIGRPNVGKSTLLNELIGEKISIISNKPQTTRNTIQLIYTDDRMQVVFLDTPGVQIPKNELGEAMLKVSKDALDGVDICLFVTDTSKTMGPLDHKILDELKKLKETPIILILNKVDSLYDALPEDEEAGPSESYRPKLREGQTAEDYLNKLIEAYEGLGIFHSIIPLSAKKGQNIDQLKEAIYNLLPEGPMYFPDDMITDRSERFVVSEIIREKCLNNMSDEIPHGIYVAVDAMKMRENGKMMDVQATIFVEKESHKGMVIGKGGKMLGLIGKQARLEIERFMDTRINLKLWVKVEKNWRKQKKKVKRFGYE